MRIGKLYLKIFFSFILILFVTELLIVVFFAILIGGNSRRRFLPYVEAYALLLRESIEYRLQDAPELSLIENTSVHELVKKFDQTEGLNVWITSSSDKTLIGTSPVEGRAFHIRRREWTGTYYRNRTHGRYMPFFISIPFQLQNKREGYINLLIKRPEQRVLVKPFVAGIAGIGAGIALLLFPVSRLISRPLEKLQRSVQRIKGGDLGHRAEEKSRDEIGDLVRAFNQMADRIERMITGSRELSSNVSHELRSPLARMRVAEELLRDGLEKGEKEECRSLLNSIRDEIEEMDTLIGKILQLAKLDLRYIPKIIQQVDITSLVQETLKKYSQSIRKKNITTTFSIPDGKILVNINHEDLRTVFSNIVDNAVKFTPAGGEIRLETKKKDGTVVILLTNSCREDLHLEEAKIFEPFYRERQSGDRGSGLGLAITKRIVENNGGKIGAKLKNDLFTVKVMFIIS